MHRVGFEPTKHIASDLKSLPFDHSGTHAIIRILLLLKNKKLIHGVGFEPTKHNAADLESAPFDHSGNHAIIRLLLLLNLKLVN